MSVNKWQSPNTWSGDPLTLLPSVVNSLSISLNPFISFAAQDIGKVTASFGDSGISVKYKILGVTVKFRG